MERFMSTEHTAAESGSRLAVVLLTVLGTALIAAMVFVAKSGDAMYGLFFATEHVGLRPASLAPTMMVARLVLMVSLPIFGLLSDLTNRRVCLIAGAGLFGTAIIAKALASAMPLYLAGEIAAAVGLAIVLPTVFALALDACRTYRLLASAAAGVLLIDALSSPLASSFPAKIADAYGWRWSYGLMGGMVLLGTVAGGTLLLGAGAMARRRTWPERPGDAPRGWLWVLVVLGLVITASLVSLMDAATHSISIYLARDVLQVAVPSIGRLLAAFGLGLAGAAVIAAPLTDLLERSAVSWGRGSWARPAFVVFGLAVICSGAVLLRVSSGVTETSVAMALLGIGHGVMTPALVASLAMNVRHRWWASVIGLYQAAGHLATTVGAAGAAAMLARVGYVPNGAQSAETIAGFRSILSIALGVGVLALVVAAASAAVHLVSRRSQNA
jgi:MFS family permease